MIFSSALNTALEALYLDPKDCKKEVFQVVKLKAIFARKL